MLSLSGSAADGGMGCAQVSAPEINPSLTFDGCWLLSALRSCAPLPTAFDLGTGFYLLTEGFSHCPCLPSLLLAPIFSCYIFKEVPLLARNLESTSLPPHLFLPLGLAEALLYTQTRSHEFICVYQNPSHSIFHSVTEGTSNTHLS